MAENLLSKEDKEKALTVIGFMTSEQRDSFILEFKKLDRQKKDKVLRNVIANEDAIKEAGVVKERAIARPEALSSPSEALSTVGRLFQREEAIVSEPIMNILRRFDEPALGAPQREDVSLIESVQRAASGKSFSEFKRGRQAELGDVFQKVGVPSAESKVAGLLLSQFLPSGLGISFVGRGIVKQGAKQVAKRQLAKQASKKATIDNFSELFRNLSRETSTTQKVGSEVMESLTNVPSDDILFAMNNPKVISQANSRPEALEDLARKVSLKASSSIKKNPDLFQVDERIFSDKASEIVGEFNNLAKEARDKFVSVKKQTMLRRPEGLIPKGDVSRSIKLTMREFDLLDDAGNIKSIRRESPVAKTMNEVLGRLKKDFPDRPLTLEEITDFQKTIGDTAFKRSVDSGSVGKVLPEVDAATKKLYSKIRNTFRRAYSTEPQLLDAYDQFSSFANLRGDVARVVKSEKRLASMLRRIDRQNPEQLQELMDLLDSIPNGGKHLGDINTILDLKEDSLVNRIPGLKRRTPKAIEKDLTTLFKKDFHTLTRPEKDALQKLEIAIRSPFTKDLVGKKVAQQFAKKTNFFRGIASGGVLGATFFAGLGPSAALPGAVAGFLATDPRAQGALIRGVGTLAERLRSSRTVEGLIQAGKLGGTAVTRSGLPSATLRRLIQEQGE